MTREPTEMEQRLIDVAFDVLPGRLYQEDAERLVRAMIRAMRVPTPEMVDVVGRSQHSRMWIIKSYIAMIDVATPPQSIPPLGDGIGGTDGFKP